MKTLGDILSDREEVAEQILSHLDHATDDWGIKVERVEVGPSRQLLTSTSTGLQVKDVRLPQSLQRAMAAEAEAAREARAKVIAAEGEQKASKALKEASDIISTSPAALQLRWAARPAALPYCDLPGTCRLSAPSPPRRTPPSSSRSP